MPTWVIPGASTSPVASVFGRFGAITAQTGDYNTSQVTESGNLYYTQSRFDAAFGLKSTDGLTEGSSNLYFTDVRAQNALSGTVAGINSTLSTVTGSIAGINSNLTSITGSIATTNGNVGSLSGTVSGINTNLSSLSGSLGITNSNLDYEFYVK